jgi:ribonuclease J
MKIHSVGGFSEVGKNMSVLELGEDAFIFDEGFFLPAIVQMQEKEEYKYTEQKLRSVKAIPDDLVIDSIRHKIRAQLIGHAHLDHVGAVPFISNRYNAPIYGTPFTNAVLDSLLKDEGTYLNNPVKTIQPNSSFYIQGKNKKYLAEFINITHSTPQTSMIAIHTDEGVVVYANDFKLDDNPVLGLKPNYEKLKELSKEGVKAVIIDSLYSGSDKKTPSERIARNLLEEVLFGIREKDAAIFVTTFSSHIARLKSIVEFGNKLGREIIFLGRSLNKYSEAAREVGISPFMKDVKICAYRRQVEKVLHQIEKKRKNYLVVCTGHQGEPGSILDRLSRNQLPFRFEKKDNLIFSSSVIPTPTNQENFSKMEEKLKKRQLKIFKDVHVSGHGGREDLREVIRILNPEHIIPSHGGEDKTKPMINLSNEMGYKTSKQVHLLRDGISLTI